jgi:hypothetical protein
MVDNINEDVKAAQKALAIQAKEKAAQHDRDKKKAAKEIRSRRQSQIKQLYQKWKMNRNQRKQLNQKLLLSR